MANQQGAPGPEATLILAKAEDHRIFTIHTLFPSRGGPRGVSYSVTAAIHTLCTGWHGSRSLAWRMETTIRFCFLLVGQDVNKGHWKDPLPFRLSFDVPNPPLLILFPCDNNHFSLDEGELVVVVCLAVVNGLHASHFILPRVDLSG